MSVNSSGRTIIINGLKIPSLLYPANNKSLSVCTMKADVNCAETQKKGRKRSLEHLSFEEKLLRKKLKNREAAQSSRDRKKARMDELEHTVKLLGKCNKELTAHVKELENAKGELELENDRLREEVRCLRNRYDCLRWLAESDVDLTNLNELVKDLFAQSNNPKDYDEFFDEMVGSSSTMLESSRSESPASDISELSFSKSAPVHCDTLIDPPSLLANEVKTSVDTTEILDVVTDRVLVKCVSKSPVQIKEEAQIVTLPEFPLKTENVADEEMFVEMISEEVVITSEDLSLYDACDAKPELSSSCSDADIDERNIDQGYESSDSPKSDTDHSLSELFPDLPYQYEYMDSEILCCRISA